MQYCHSYLYTDNDHITMATMHVLRMYVQAIHKCQLRSVKEHVPIKLALALYRKSSECFRYSYLAKLFSLNKRQF